MIFSGVVKTRKKISSVLINNRFWIKERQLKVSRNKTTFLLVMIWFKINQKIVKVKYLKLYMRKMLLSLCTQQSDCLPRGHYLQSLDWRQREKQTNPSGYPLNLQMSDQGRGILTSKSCWDVQSCYLPRLVNYWFT